jgi:hypothetical protein
VPDLKMKKARFNEGAWTQLGLLCLPLWTQLELLYQSMQ